jgi:GNAT superfamily N-acetyltransferase
MDVDGGGVAIELELRPGSPDDAEACGDICYAAFAAIAEQHNYPPDWSQEGAASFMSSFLARPDIYSVVAVLNGRVVGSNFLSEEATIAGVGPVTVDPAVQDASIGRRMMEDVLGRARDRGVVGVRLVQATYHRRSLALYSKLGFDARELLVALQGDCAPVDVAGRTVRVGTKDDVADCDALCTRVHGHDRTAEVRHSVAQDSALVVEQNGRLTGYATSIGFFGHAVGESNDDLKALIGSAPAISGPGFLLPARNAELLRWCLERGLRIVQPMTLMTRGLYNEPASMFLPSIVY